MTAHQDRVMAYVVLLALPDPPGMRRAHRITQSASPFVDKEKAKHTLALAYLAWRLHSFRGIDEFRSAYRESALRTVMLRIARRA